MLGVLTSNLPGLALVLSSSVVGLFEGFLVYPKQQTL